jgi:hypothetical protein
MNTFSCASLFAVLLLPVATLRAQQPVETSTPHPRIAEGRAIARQFGGELKAALEQAIAKQGPAQAIQVCRDEAPRIAARLTEEHGALVSRTALKVRNPANAAQPWQRAALEKFQDQLAAGASAESAEFFTMREDGSARYLKAIVTAPMCTMCHGETIAPDIQRALQERYPADQATGFKAGDLRGAFSIEWPALTDDAR